jgi:hypothetical protein
MQAFWYAFIKARRAARFKFYFPFFLNARGFHHFPRFCTAKYRIGKLRISAIVASNAEKYAPTPYGM